MVYIHVLRSSTKWLDYFCQKKHKKNMLTRFSQSLLRPGGAGHGHFGGAAHLLVLLKNEWLRPHRGNWKGDLSLSLVFGCDIILYHIDRDIMTMPAARGRFGYW